LKAMALQTLIGVTLAVVIYRSGGLMTALWALPFVGGLCLAIPFTMVTASAAFGRLSARLGLFAIPEESHMPRVLSRIIPDAARRWRRLSDRRPATWATADTVPGTEEAAGRP
jgi:membrane glycosyltransferase